jgi:hypothetical protein
MDAKILSFVVQLSNHELLARVKHLAEGCSSLFTYCTHRLCLSEHAAYGRIEAARMVRRFPVLLERLEEGSVNLTTVGLLAAHLTPENHRELLELARHKSKRQIEELVAGLRPQPPVHASVRRLPTVRHTAASPRAQHDAAATPQPTGDGQGVASPGLPAPALTPRERPAVVAPLALQRYKVQFTASADTVEKLRLAQALLRHQIPDGDPAAIFDRALTALLQELAKRKFAATDRPRGGRGTDPGSRHIPAEVKRAVWLRDGGRCAFVGRNGRCTEQDFLEFHHVAPYAAGGQSTADNIQLRCRAHNGYEAELYFGPGHPGRVREAQACPSHPLEQQRPRSRLGIPATTRSGPSTESVAPSGPPPSESAPITRWIRPRKAGD